ncbi:nucleoside hydrolase-like domain-containing protein [Actinoplanes sp. CA-131856]
MKLRALAALTALIVPAAASPAAASPSHHQFPRTIVTTDGEADDMNSMMRFLYYTNEIDVDGLVYSSSVHHWKGDGDHTLAQAKDAGILTSFNGQTAGTPANSADATTWRWNPDRWIEKQISQYDRILPTLRKHDARYPSARELRSKVAVGNIDFENDFSADTAGSDLIKSALLDNDRRDLWLQAWGGQNTIARALKSIEEQYKGTRQWAAVRAKVAGKAVIATIGNQDNAYADYIGKSWPGIRVYNWGFTFTSWTGGKTNAAIPESIKPYYTNAWWKPNIKTGHGPLLDGYHLIGDGQYLKGESEAPGWQPGLAGIKYDLATWRLYDFVGPFERYDFLSEGDTPAFLPLIGNGLRFLDDPTLGGWGGRFAATGAQFAPQGDVNPVTGRAEAAYSLYRWVPDAEDDFAARADWGVTSSYKKANHAPTVTIRQKDLSARPGQTLTLRAAVTDPDRDRVTSTWSVYTEASTATGAVLTGSRLTVPAGATAGQRVVLTLTATDNGRHTLSGYGQVVVTVR